MKEDNEVLELSLKLKDKKVKLDGADYILQEMTGAQRDAYSQSQNERFVMGADGKVASIKSWEGMQSSLLALCLCVVKENKPVPVPEDVIQTWPASTQKALFDAAQKLNGLDLKPDELEEKVVKD